jgi:hypothetical protein
MDRAVFQFACDIAISERGDFFLGKRPHGGLGFAL